MKLLAGLTTACVMAGSTAACSVHPAVRVVEILATASAWTAPGTPPLRDCTSTVPADLAAALEKRYPAHRLSVETDYLPEDVAGDLSSGGSGCFGVASADFDGDRTTDYGIVLAERGGDGIVVVAARHVKGRWAIDEFHAEGVGRGNWYVRIAAAGRQRNMYSPRVAEYDADEVQALNAAHPGLVVGTIDSASAGYFWTRRGWVHLQFGD